MAWWSKHALPEFLDVPWGLRDVLVFVLAWFGLQIVIGVIMALAAPYWQPLHWFVTAAQKGTDIGAVFGFYLIDVAAGLGVVWLFLRHYRVGWRTVGWRTFNVVRMVKYLLLLIVGFLVTVSIVLFLVSVLVPAFNANQAQNNQFISDARQQPSLALVALVLLPPVLEETIFRGFLFPALAKRWGIVWGAVLSSALFGIAHWQANVSVYTFILGLALCFMYVKLKSIVPGMFLHMLNNYLAYIAINHK